MATLATACSIDAGEAGRHAAGHQALGDARHQLGRLVGQGQLGLQVGLQVALAAGGAGAHAQPTKSRIAFT